ncbi:MAG: nuclear transport factor 2 family protein [Steroidobacteraceae bacterium]
MDRPAYDRYLARFNRCDPTAFDDYMTPDARMINGGLEMRGIAAIQDHYQNKIWPFFEETVTVERFVLDGSTLAARLWTHFVARNDADTVFGAVKKGEMFDYRGLVMYEIVGGRFARIDVSYLTFSRTTVDGKTTLLGLPH